MKEHPVIFYDGVCGLCDRSVQFIIRHDKKRLFRFATLQSDYAKQVLGRHISYDSFVYYNHRRAYSRSSAALKVFSRLGGPWPLLYVFMLVPALIRNAVYDWVARNRYRWFGKYEQCKIPTPEERALFLDQQ